MSDEIVKPFWDQQAEEHGGESTATTPDTFYHILEIEKIKQHLTGPDVLDVGCGNGFALRQFKEEHPDWRFGGMDISDKMIEQAMKADPSGIYLVGDIRTAEIPGPYNCIVSERCLINLLKWEEQQQALLNMKRMLAPGGRIVLVENFNDGLKNLNHLRERFELEPIKQRFHNRYMEAEEFYPFIEEHFDIKFAENIGNLYYIISRVVYAAICEIGGTEPEYDHPINQIAAGLPALGNYNFSPNMLHILEAK